jgi:hypothetical protein
MSSDNQLVALHPLSRSYTTPRLGPSKQSSERTLVLEATTDDDEYREIQPMLLHDSM